MQTVSVCLHGACLMGVLLPTATRASRPIEIPPVDWADQITLTDGWEFVRGDLGGVWETLRSTARALELPVWSAVALPHCVNAVDAVDPDVPYYQGPSWYRTRLEIANPHPRGRTLLHFEGVGQRSQVWVGEVLVASHEGGYDEFLVDVTDAVAVWRASSVARLPAAEMGVPPGRVPVAVRADNTRDLETIPSDLSDFNRYGGIYRPVHLVYLPAGGLERVHATPRQGADGRWQVEVSARFITAAEADRAQRVRLRMMDPDGMLLQETSVAIEGDATSTTIATLPIDAPRLWSTKHPNLYGLEVVAQGAGGESRAWTRFGLRTFQFVERGPFKLNGERLLLRGTHRHEDHAGVAAAMTVPQMEEEMRLMRAMGVNFIRLGHYQQSRRILELCDELGMVVWEEIPWCRGGLGGERYQEQARAMLRAMIDQHRNHPSVILWGLGNENDWPGDFSMFDQDAIRAFMRELHDLSHQLDPTRLTAIRRCDFCKDIVDVYSPSIWAGWYRGRFTEYKEVSRREMERVKHFLHVEWGGDSHAGRHAEDPYIPLRTLQKAGAADERGLDFMGVGGDVRASRDGDWSESYICDMVDWHLKEQETMDWLTGTAMWPFKDFSTPLRPDNPVPFVNQKGAVERDLTPKEPYYVYQSYWSEQPMLRIYGHSWPVRWGKAGESRVVKVYSNCEEVELWLNGRSLGRRTRDTQDYPAAGLRWSVAFEQGMNELRARGTNGGTTLDDAITVRYETRQWGKPHHLRLQRMPSIAADRVRVRVELLDANGVVCLDARDFLRFGHAGDGRMLDNLGLADGARRVQLANGRAEIEVALPEGGRAQVSARAEIDGVPSAFLEVDRRDAAARAEGERLIGLSRQERRAMVADIDRARILRLAEQALAREPVTLRSVALPDHAIKAGVRPGDFLSMGDYWWPDPTKPDGLPYIRRDGESNPGNFDSHRLIMRELRDNVAALAAAYVATGDQRHAAAAERWLRVFFVDPDTRMHPHLNYAQAIPGVTPGRGIGIIDTLHLAEVALAAIAIDGGPGVTPATMDGVRAWFAAYLKWMLTHPNGLEEAATVNNHRVAYWLQAAAFARLTRDEAVLERARRDFMQVVVPDQMALDGSFPRELARTKPYGYSIFQLDNVALLAELLGTPARDLWNWSLPDGRGLERAIGFLQPYLAASETWPFAADIAHFEAWPVRQPALLLGALRLGRPEWLRLWQRLDPDPENLEVRRNMAVTQPLLWL